MGILRFASPRTPAHPLTSIETSGSAPGAEFYAERLARAQAVPEEQRSSDTKAWLALHSELEAATALLPPLPASATAQRPLLEPLGGDAALAGAPSELLPGRPPPLCAKCGSKHPCNKASNGNNTRTRRPPAAGALRFLAGSYAGPAFNSMPPFGELRRLAPQLPPLMHVWSEGWCVEMEPALLLEEMLDGGSLENADDADLEVLARLLLVAAVSAGLWLLGSDHTTHGPLQPMQCAMFYRHCKSLLSPSCASLLGEPAREPALTCASFPLKNTTATYPMVPGGRLPRGPAVSNRPLCAGMHGAAAVCQRQHAGPPAGAPAAQVRPQRRRERGT